MGYDPTTGTFQKAPLSDLFDRAVEYRNRLLAQGVRITVPQAFNRICMCDALKAVSGKGSHAPAD